MPYRNRVLLVWVAMVTNGLWTLQADEAFAQTYKARIDEMMGRQEREEETLNQEAKEAIRELEAIQEEKKQHLVELEEKRMREKDAQHGQEMKEWRNSLSSRKKVSSMSPQLGLDLVTPDHALSFLLPSNWRAGAMLSWSSSVSAMLPATTAVMLFSWPRRPKAS